jgi:hypothetical protein
VDKALDAATDAITAAVAASPNRRYRCERCQASVILKGVANKQVRIHFAHAKGEADPDCEDYFPRLIPFTGRRSGASDGNEQLRADTSTDLYFDLDASGPTLYVWLPKSRETKSWTGAIGLEAHRVSRRLTSQHLRDGQLISFPLADGQWRISTIGQVSEDYESRLVLGANSLESGLNIFDATHSPGRRVGPSTPLRLGNAVWVVTRHQSFPAGGVGTGALPEIRASRGGWHVFYIMLPDAASTAEASGLAKWLQRSIRPAQAKVWIKAPWATGYTPEGIPVLPLLPAGLQIEADRVLDIEIREQSTQRLSARAEQTRTLRWDDPNPGRWVIVVNEQPFSMFDLLLEPPVAGPAVAAITADGKSLDLFAAQNIIGADESSGTQQFRSITWSAESIAPVISLDRRTVDGLESPFELNASLHEQISVSAGNLGELEIRSSRPLRQLTTSSKVQNDLLHTATWLETVAYPAKSRVGVSCFIPAAFCVHPRIAGLRHRRWPAILQPQLRNFTRRLERAI